MSKSCRASSITEPMARRWIRSSIMGRTRAFAPRTPPVVASPTLPLASGTRVIRNTGRRRPCHQRRTTQTDPITLRGLYPSAAGLWWALMKRTRTPSTSVLCGAAVQTERLWESIDPLIGGPGGAMPPRPRTSVRMAGAEGLEPPTTLFEVLLPDGDKLWDFLQVLVVEALEPAP